MFEDSFFPSFSNIFLYGLDFDFMMLEVLVISCMDRTNYLDNKI